MLNESLDRSIATEAVTFVATKVTKNAFTRKASLLFLADFARSYSADGREKYLWVEISHSPDSYWDGLSGRNTN